MKRLSCLILLLAAFSLPALSQARDSLLRHINRIKLDTDRYLYGLATVPGEPAPEPSLAQARGELDIQVENYLGGKEEFVFLKEKKVIPEQLFESVSCLIRPDTYRTIVYVEKARLLDVELSLAAQLGSDSRKEALQDLVSGILGAATIEDVLNLVASSILVDEIRTSQIIDDSTQELVNNALLVYFDTKTKKVLEVMTPASDGSFARKNAVTGAPANPLRYKNAPLWVYVDGLKTANVL